MRVSASLVLASGSPRRSALLAEAGFEFETVSPGVFHNGISVSGQGSLIMNPGVYYMSGGGFSFTGQGNLTATGVMIVNLPRSNSDKININGTGAIRLSPMLLGLYRGISLWQQRSSTNEIAITGNGTSQITGTVPAQAVFQTERFGEFTYTITGRTPNRAQTVTLYFQESFWSAAGQRRFNVSINGATVLTAFDIFATAGGANRAIARTFNTTASASGQVVIQFIRGGGPDNPKICGITVAGG